MPRFYPCFIRKQEKREAVMDNDSSRNMDSSRHPVSDATPVDLKPLSERVFATSAYMAGIALTLIAEYSAPELLISTVCGVIGLIVVSYLFMRCVKLDLGEFAGRVLIWTFGAQLALIAVPIARLMWLFYTGVDIGYDESICEQDYSCA